MGGLLLTGLLVALAGCSTPRPSTSDAGELTQERHFKDYTVRTYRFQESGQGWFEIRHQGRIVHLESGLLFRVGLLDEDSPGDKLIPMGRNLTGGDTPNLVVSEWTGGAHCCAEYRVFEIGEQFRLVDVIHALHTDEAHFEDLRGDGTLQFVMNDFTFAYWNACFAESPAPGVILEFPYGRYRLALDLMRRPASPGTELTALAATFTQQFNSGERLEGTEEWEAPPALWAGMLDLIYSGNLPEALWLLEQSWPADQPGRLEFLRDFMDQLAESPYFADLLALNALRRETQPIKEDGKFPSKVAALREFW